MRYFVLRLLNKYGMLSILLVISIFFIVLTDGLFLESRNLMNILRQISINAIMAIGMTFVILTGGIDLSVGAIVALSGVVATSLFAMNLGVPIYLLIVIVTIVGVFVGSLAGLISGVSITKFNIAPFIATLAMMTAARGLAFLYTGGRPIWGLPAEFNIIGRGHFLEGLIGRIIPVPVVLVGVLMVIAYVVLKHTKVGRYMYAIGNNEEAARLTGINVKKIKLMVYVVSGSMAGLAGVVLASRLASGQPNAGVAFELQAIAAVVIGGTSLMGGQGNIFGTLIGALIIGILNNGLNLLGVDSHLQLVILGMIILLAVIVDQLRANVKFS